MPQAQTFVPGPETSRAFRDALGCFATGVTVVTTMTAQGPLGITVNSFSSLSLDPPLVLWAPAKDSGRYQPFVAAPHFAIHVLAEDQFDLAMAFAKNGTAFDAVDWSPSDEGTPCIETALARFECRHHAAYDGGDHKIVVGEVLRASHRPGRSLIFSQGDYGGFSGTD